MEPHTPKREAIEKFVHQESGIAKDWSVRVVEDSQEPVVRLQARKAGTDGEPEKSLEVHSRQVRLSGDELDEATQTLVRRWLASL